MTPLLVQQGYTVALAGTVVLGSNITPGNLVIAVISQYKPGGVPEAPTISGGGVSSWTDLASVPGTPGINCHIYGNVSTGGTGTITYDGDPTIGSAGDLTQCVVAEFSGVSPVGPVTGDLAWHGTSPAPCPSLTGVVGGSLGIMAMVTQYAANVPPTGWTALTNDGAGGALSTAYKLSVGPGTVSPTITFASGSSVDGVSVGVAFSSSGTPIVMIV